MNNKIITSIIALATFSIGVVLFLTVMSTFSLWKTAPSWSGVFKIELPKFLNIVKPQKNYYPDNTNHIPEGSLKGALNTKVSDICLNDKEIELASLINDYRHSKNLNVLPVTKSLTYVGRVHIYDLIENKPYLGSRCDQHSWSNSKYWTGGCAGDFKYDLDLVRAKARELKTGYNYDIWEIVDSAWIGEKVNGVWIDEKNRQPVYDFTMARYLDDWKHSYGHNNELTNANDYSDRYWQAMGVAVRENYAIVWFGENIDPNGNAERCQ
jgi:uncharacterized protein YkwD